MTDPLLLALETSTRSASVTLATRTLQRTRALDDSRRHATDLIPTIDALCEEHGRRPTHLAVGIGPGSYTGLRVGLATILGLARALELPVFALPSFETLAFAHAPLETTVTVVTNAYASRHYHGRYLRTQAEVITLSPEQVLSRPDAKRQLREHATDLIFTDEVTANALSVASPTRHRACVPTSEALSRLTFERFEQLEPTPLSELEPLYLQPFGG